MRTLRRKDRLALKSGTRVAGGTKGQPSGGKAPRDHSEATVEWKERDSHAKKQRLIRVNAKAARAQDGRGYGADTQLSWQHPDLL